MLAELGWRGKPADDRKGGNMGQDEHGASEIPFELTRYLNLAGALHGDRPEVVASLTEGDPLWLNREPDNSHDRNAIAVYAEAGQAGYIKADDAKMLAPLIDSGTKVAARVVDVHEYVTSSGRSALGVQVILDFGSAAEETLSLHHVLGEEDAAAPGGGAKAKAGGCSTLILFAVAAPLTLWAFLR